MIDTIEAAVFGDPILLVLGIVIAVCAAGTVIAALWWTGAKARR